MGPDIVETLPDASIGKGSGENVVKLVARKGPIGKAVTFRP